MPERAAGAGAATERRRRAPGARHRAGRGIARRPPQKEPGGARQCPRSAVPASVGREVLPDSGRGAAAAPLRERGRLYAERDAARHGSFAGWDVATLSKNLTETNAPYTRARYQKSSLLCYNEIIIAVYEEL